MHADWEQLMSTYKNTDGILIASAKCETNSGSGSGSSLCNHYNLKYYPYIVYGNPASPQEYDGYRDYNSLYSFAQQHLGAALDAPEATVSGGTLQLTWEDCGDASTHGKISGIDKDQVVLGEETTVTGTGTTDEDVSGGDFTITAKAGLITQKYMGKVCEAKEFDLPLGLGQVNWNGLACPAAAGEISVAVGVKLASIIPSQYAKADIQVSATGSSTDDKLLCMSLHTAPLAAQEQPVCVEPVVV